VRGERQTDVTCGRASQGDGAPGRPDGRGRPDGAGSRPDGLGDGQEEGRTITWRRDGGGRRGERGPARPAAAGGARSRQLAAVFVRG
jgi:hypothetical protein